MKKILLAIIAFSGTMACLAQDSTNINKTDTIKVGGMVIIKKHGENGKGEKKVTISNHRRHKLTNISTNWWIVDVGFANINDKTNYAAAQAQGFTGMGVGSDQFKLKTIKSVDVNIWIFMQRLNLIKHVVNLKYGLGVELNNYRFDDETVRFSKNPTTITIDPSLKSGVEKNKLAADYVTVPLMLNFNLTPGREHGFGFSGGLSAGYLYDARQKIKQGGKKTKLHDDFDLEPWKLSYVAELYLGPVHLYGSYAVKSMWSKALDQTPYTVGIRFGHL